MASFGNFLRTPGRLFIDKTEYIKKLDEVSDYCYMFLHPRRFGKSTFLDTLCKYYDIAESHSFHGLFGGLYIGKYPTKYRNSQLVLQLDLSSIDISGDIACTERSFNETVNTDLKFFLQKYQHFLGGGRETETILKEDASRSLINVFVSEHWL